MIIYKFPVKSFRASQGYTTIIIDNHTLKLDKEPDEATLALIEKYSGRQVTTRKRKKTKAVK
jgi:uncharacterized protein YcbX